MPSSPHLGLLGLRTVERKQLREGEATSDRQPAARSCWENSVELHLVKHLIMGKTTFMVEVHEGSR